MSSSLRNTVASLLSFSAVLLAVPSAAAQGDVPEEADRGSGIAVGVRAGYGVPSGNFFDEFAMDERISGVFAPQVDMGYFINGNVYLGIHGQFGIARLHPDLCPRNPDCGGKVLRFGVDVRYHFFPDSSVRPWLGAGFGYEFTRLSAVVNGVVNTVNFKGMEWAHVDAGLDFKVHEQVWVGPQFTATAGQFSRVVLTEGAWEYAGEPESPSPHFWLQPGLRLQVRL